MCFVFFKQKTAYEMRISDWSSDVCSSDLDLVDSGARARLAAILRHLNPRARIVHAEFGRVPLAQVLDTGLFDFAQASQAPGWLKELRGEHTPETQEYGKIGRASSRERVCQYV